MAKNTQNDRSEAKVESNFKARIEQNGGICFKLYTLTVSGLPDRVVLMPGRRFYLVELKKVRNGKPTGLSPIQRWMHKKFMKLGFEVDIVFDDYTTELFIEKILKDQ